MRRILCRIVGHFWHDTHANRYGIATRQECRCGAVREWHGGPGGKWHTTPALHPHQEGQNEHAHVSEHGQEAGKP